MKPTTLGDGGDLFLEVSLWLSSEVEMEAFPQGCLSQEMPAPLCRFYLMYRPQDLVGGFTGAKGLTLGAEKVRRKHPGRVSALRKQSHPFPERSARRTCLVGQVRCDYDCVS